MCAYDKIVSSHFVSSSVVFLGDEHCERKCDNDFIRNVDLFTSLTKGKPVGIIWSVFFLLFSPNAKKVIDTVKRDIDILLVNIDNNNNNNNNYSIFLPDLSTS
jgi:hypothetical protein